MRPGRAKRVLTRAAGCLGSALALATSVLAVACQAPGLPLVPVAVRATLPAPQPGVPTATPAPAPAPAEPSPVVPSPALPSPTPAVVVAPTPAISAPPAQAAMVWLAYGDSITYDAFRELAGWGDAFAPDLPPEVRNAGVAGMTSLAALARLDAVLATHPDAAAVGLAFGTNDVYSETVPVADFIDRLRQMAVRVREGGRTPMLARIAWSPLARMARVAAFNEAIETLEEELDLAPGPDLYAWFRAHPEELEDDGIHLRDDGDAAIRRLWAGALRGVR